MFDVNINFDAAFLSISFVHISLIPCGPLIKVGVLWKGEFCTDYLLDQ